MILCYKKALTQSRKKIDGAPDGSIRVTLPIKVQTDPRTRAISGKNREDGAHVIVAIFTGFVTEYAIKQANEYVTFEK